MAVPWTGFPLKALVDFAKPLGSARNTCRWQTFKDTGVAPGQKQFWYPWPYIEGLTMAEATNDLAFMVTGMYGKPLPKQNGAPLRLATPWKYGFKSVKSIVQVHLHRPAPGDLLGEARRPSEYGFWANVNPEVPHPRWSQASERVLGTDERRADADLERLRRVCRPMYDGLEGREALRLNQRASIEFAWNFKKNSRSCCKKSILHVRLL